MRSIVVLPQPEVPRSRGIRRPDVEIDPRQRIDRAIAQHETAVQSAKPQLRFGHDR